MGLEFGNAGLSCEDVALILDGHVEELTEVGRCETISTP